MILIWFQKRDLPHTGLLDTAGRNLPNLPEGKKERKRGLKRNVMQRKKKNISLSHLRAAASSDGLQWLKQGGCLASGAAAGSATRSHLSGSPFILM